MRRLLLTCASALALITTPAPPANAHLGEPAAIPTVTGPIPSTGGPRDHPFFATDQNLGKAGYIEEEYFVEGTASRYTTPDQTTGTVIDSGHPYRTRIVVRRPISPKRFNGTAIVEWYNVTNNFDYEVMWSRSFRHILDEGYAWVGVSAQRNGVHTPTGLKAWNPARYGALDLTAGGAVTDDGLAYDVFTQAAKALTEPRGARPLGNLKVRTLIATGQSQSASRLAVYANSVHPLAPTYDVITVVDGGVRIRADLTTKVFKTASEYDVLANQAARRQPDSDRFTYWEIAGASHSDRHAYLVNNPIRLRDAGVSGLLAGPTAPCVSPARSNVPYEYVLNAMFDHSARWARENRRPPAAPQLEITDVTTSPATVTRDAYQIARGGIRLAAVDVPTERNTGWNLGLTDATASACRQGGTWIPFDETTLDELYPSHRDYVAKVRQVTERNLRDGFITRRDADRTIRDAERSLVGR